MVFLGFPVGKTLHRTLGVDKRKSGRRDSIECAPSGVGCKYGKGLHRLNICVEGRQIGNSPVMNHEML